VRFTNQAPDCPILLRLLSDPLQIRDRGSDTLKSLYLRVRLWMARALKAIEDDNFAEASQLLDAAEKEGPVSLKFIRPARI